MRQVMSSALSQHAVTICIALLRSDGLITGKHARKIHYAAKNCMLFLLFAKDIVFFYFLSKALLQEPTLTDCAQQGIIDILKKTYRTAVWMLIRSLCLIAYGMPGDKHVASLAAMRETILSPTKKETAKRPHAYELSTVSERIRKSHGSLRTYCKPWGLVIPWQTVSSIHRTR